MKITKKIIKDGVLATTSEINFLYSDGSEHSVSCIKSKDNDDTTYTLYSDGNENVAYCYQEIIKLLEEQYKIKIYPIYFGESDYSLAKFKLGDIDFSLSCYYENEVIFLSSNQNTNENDFSDNLAVYLVYNLVENGLKKNRSIK